MKTTNSVLKLLTAALLVSSLDGTVLSSGTLLSQETLLVGGVVLADEVLLPDGVLLSDSTLASSTSASVAQALAMAALRGDQTSSMPAESDSDPSN